MAADTEARARPEALAELAERDALARLADRDPSLWSDDPDIQRAIADRLGWLDPAAGSPAWREEVAHARPRRRRRRLHRVVLAGMGGSSLASEVFASVFEGVVAGAQLDVLDSTHPGAVHALLDAPDLSATLVLVSSKSGATEETRCLVAHAQRRLADLRRRW